MAHSDILGNPITEGDEQLLAVYESVKALLVRDDLAPCVRSNARVALAALWQAVNDQNIAFEQISEYGV